MQPFAKWVVPFLFAGTVMGSTPLTLREKIQTVTSSANRNETGNELADKDSVAVPRCLRTGSDSRAQFDFENGLIRLGAGTDLELHPAAKQMRLQKGSALYQRLSRGHRLTVEISGLDVVVTGDSGFAQLMTEQENGASTLCVGAIAGETVVRVDGQSYPLQPADMLVIKPGGKVLLGNFNLPKMVQSSVLINGFKAPLLDAAAIQRESKRFASLEARGFIQPLERITLPREETAPDILANRDQVNREQSGSGVPSSSQGNSSADDGNTAGLREGINISANASFSIASGMSVGEDFGFKSKSISTRSTKNSKHKTPVKHPSQHKVPVPKKAIEDNRRP